MDELSEVVTELATRQMGLDRFRHFLSIAALHIGEIDLKAIKRDGAESELFSEIENLMRLRNKVIHQCKSVQKRDSNHAIELFHFVFENVFVEIINGLDLCFLSDGKIDKEN